MLRKCSEIIELIKDQISLRYGDRKIYDLDVAIELNITYSNIATMKSRNKIPYKEICEFALIERINPNTLLYK